MPSSLSITKLSKLIQEKGFAITKFYTEDGVCFFMELLALKTADLFLLYIPSRYNFPVDKGNSGGRDVYKIKNLEIGSGSHIPDEYGQLPSELDLRDIYEPSSNMLSTQTKDDIEEDLEKNYKQQIVLSDVSKADKRELKSVYRQLRRLKYAVQNIGYKLAITYKNFLCCIRRDDSIDFFLVRDYPGQNVKKLFVIFDLEMLYEQNERVISDMVTVQENIHKILERGQLVNGNALTSLLENRKDILAVPDRVQSKRLEYEGMLSELRAILNEISEKERDFLEKIYILNSDTGSGIQGDIEKAQRRSRLEQDLEKICKTKGEITSSIVDLRAKISNFILGVDSAMFDITVMYDTLVKSFAKIKEFY